MLLCFVDSQQKFLKKPAEEPPADSQLPMVIENDKKGDSDGQVALSDSDNNSAPDPKHENKPPNSNTGSGRDMEESDFTRPQEELLFIN